jgi:hypothetical protein
MCQASGKVLGLQNKQKHTVFFAFLVLIVLWRKYTLNNHTNNYVTKEISDQKEKNIILWVQIMKESEIDGE